MTHRQLTYLLLVLIAVFLTADILVRLFYGSSLHLLFNSQEFNNISSPIISFLGFVGVIITVLLTLKQFKHQQGSNYFNYYRDFISNIAKESPQNNDGISFSTSELLKFPIYSWGKYDDIKSHSQYFEDLNKFNNGETVNSENKPYDLILGNVRFFSASLDILLKRYISLILEIDTHKNLDPSQKGLLLKDLFDSQVEKYYNGCWLIDFDAELKEVKANLYIAFAPVMKDELLFYSSGFYRLKNFIDKRPDLRKLTESHILKEAS